MECLHFYWGGGILAIYKGPLLKALYRAIFDSGMSISPNGLNLGWIVQFYLENFHAEIYGSLYDDGSVQIIWNAVESHLKFRYVFVAIYILPVLIMFLNRKKDITSLLKCSLAGYTAYFTYNTGVHENHLFLAMMLMFLLYLKEPTSNNGYRMIMYTLLFNFNLIILYGISGKGTGFSRAINNVFGPTVLVAIFNVIYLTSIVVQLLCEVKAQLRER